jgi:hypothetical protein
LRTCLCILGEGDGTSSSTAGIIAGSVIGGVILILICFCCCLYLCGRHCGILRGRPLRSNNRYVQSGVTMPSDIGHIIFQPGAFQSFYYQYNARHGPYNMTLAFYPEAGYIVHGGGSDNIGSFVITGIYSPRTLRMGLEKHYQLGTGDPTENLGHTVTIQVKWNHENQQFQGKYYLQTRRHRDENEFIIRFQYANHRHPYSIERRV